MAQLLGDVAVGTTVYLNENGSPQPYLIVHQGKPSSLYDESCNGTWLLRTDIYANAAWNSSSNNNTFVSATINTTYLPNLISIYDSAIQNSLKTVKIPYCVGNGTSQVNSNANGYECKLFLLSGYELGWTTSTGSLPVDGAKLSYFLSGTGTSANNKRLAKLNGKYTSWWTRSQFTKNSLYTFFTDGNGGYGNSDCFFAYGVRPAMVMPTNLLVDDSNNIISIPTITTLTAPSVAMQGQSIPLSWTSVSVSGFSVTYQLQRNINNTSWENVGSPISQTSYTDTAQSGWTQVQYQVAPVVDGVIGNYIQSSIIPVSDPQALVISGSDSNLGTLTSNIPYTVSSNTGNQISLTRTVNGVQVASITVNSGFAYNIPIADLPTGEGTIVITASVQSSSGLVTATRSWTYTKTPIDIPSTGGIAQLTQNSQNIWPITVPDAVQAPAYLGGNLNAAFNYFSKSLENNSKYLDQAVYYKTGTIVTKIGDMPEGSIVYFNENDSPIPFYIAKQDYEPNYNSNRTLIVRKDVLPDEQAWNSRDVNTYANGALDTWLNGTYKNTLDPEIQSAIATTTFRYTPGNGNYSVTTLARGVFIPSITEFGKSSSTANVEGSTLPIADKLASNTYIQWSRSPKTDSTSAAMAYSTNGAATGFSCTSTEFIRPMFTLPSDYVYSSIETTGFYDMFNNLLLKLPAAQIETGSYVGTGTYEENNPNSLTFGFVPKFVCIEEIGSIPVQAFFIYNASYTRNTSSTNSNSDIKVTWDSNTLSWYSGSSSSQLNDNSRTYYYIAIG